MTRQPKTPRTPFQRLEFRLFGDIGYRRLPKGRRAKSGQWWRRTAACLTFAEIVNEAWPQPARRVVDIDSGFVVIDEHHDGRRVMGAMEKWPAGQTSAATDTTIMEALDSHRRTNA